MSETSIVALTSDAEREPIFRRVPLIFTETVSALMLFIT